MSTEGEDGWAAWCRAEDFGLDRLGHVHDVTLAQPDRLLWLEDAAGIDRFTAEYGVPWGPSFLGLDQVWIDWTAVARDFDGLVIAPYVWSRRLHPASHWYYGWDCASGCIWDAEVVGSVSPRVTDQLCTGAALAGTGRSGAVEFP